MNRSKLGALLLTAGIAGSGVMAIVWPRAAVQAGRVVSYSGPVAASLVFEDEFVGDAGLPDPVKWAINGNGRFEAELEGDRLHLHAEGTDGQSNAEPAAILPELLTDARLESDIIIPPPGGKDRFFLTFGLRAPMSLESAYLLVVTRNPAGSTTSWRLQKYVDHVNTRLTPDITLSNTVHHYRLRFEVVGDVIRGSVRDFSLGPIPEGDWDLQVTDRELVAAGTARPNLTKLPGEGTADAYVDNFRVFRLVPAPPPGPTARPQARPAAPANGATRPSATDATARSASPPNGRAHPGASASRTARPSVRD